MLHTRFVLLTVTRSRAETTRKQALDNISGLSVYSPYLLELMKSLNTAAVLEREEPFIWDYCDASLQLSSRMALACAKGEEAYKIFVKLDQERYEKGEMAQFMRCVNIIIRSRSPI